MVSATAVTAAGSLAAVASAGSAQTNDVEPTAAGATLLPDIPVSHQAQGQTVYLTRQAETQAVAADPSARKEGEGDARRRRHARHHSLRNPATQIKWGLSYMKGSYGSPCGAWSFWRANHWY